MKNADDVVGIAAIDRHAREGARQDLLDDLLGRQVGIDHHHVLAVNHDLVDLDIG